MNLPGHGNLESILQDPSAKPRALRLQELKEITDNFSKDRQLGKGGFGIVYKGLLPNGEAVAVKDLIMSQFQGKQFKREVDNLMKVQHKNIVRFLGYCYESSHQYIEYEATHVFAESSKMLLCFEFVANGSLDKHINEESCGFDWHTRYNIIKGICHGLHYLHEECQPHGSVIHLDLKPENILLDDCMVPKIVDFGISKFFCDQKLETRATSAIGSLGYMAPEYLSGNIVSKMADIYSLGVIIMLIITGRRVDVTSCEDSVEPVLENWRKRMEAKTSITDCEQIKACLKIGIQCVEFIKEYRPSIKEILQILSTCEGMNNGYTSDKEAYKLMECNTMGDTESHYDKKEASIEKSTEERLLMGGADDDRNGFSDEEEMPQSVNEKIFGGATENKELREPVRAETAEEMVARVGGMVPAALDAGRVATVFPGRWKAIAANLEKLRAFLLNPSSHPCLANNNALCCEVLRSVADTLAEATDLAGRCREPLTTGMLQMRSAIDCKLDVSLRDCEQLVKIGELFDDASSSPLDDSNSYVELQRLLAWLEMSHTEAKILALDGLLEALHKDEKRVVSMLRRHNVSAVVLLLTTSWPEVVRDKAATVVCHVVAGSDDWWLLVNSEVAIPRLIVLAETGSLVGRQKAAVALQHMSRDSSSTVQGIMWHGGSHPLIAMCRRTGKDSVSQSAAAGTLKNISVMQNFRQSLADHGTVRVMVGLLGRCDAVPESKQHAAECLENLTSGDNNDGLRRAVVCEGGLYALLLYLGENDRLEAAAANTIRNLVSLISTSDTMMTMKRLAGEQGCVPLLVRTMLEHESNSAREVALEMLASLATYPPNARDMIADDKCVPALVQLLDPSRNTNTANKHAMHCLLSLASTERCRNLMISHGANEHLRKLSDLKVEGATELLHRLELRKKISVKKKYRCHR